MSEPSDGVNQSNEHGPACSDGVLRGNLSRGRVLMTMKTLVVWTAIVLVHVLALSLFIPALRWGILLLVPGSVLMFFVFFMQLLPSRREWGFERQLRGRPLLDDEAFYRRFFANAAVPSEVPLRLRKLYGGVERWRGGLGEA